MTNNSKKSWLEIVTALGVLLGGAAALLAAILGEDGISSLFLEEDVGKQSKQETKPIGSPPSIKIENKPNIIIDNKPQITNIDDLSDWKVLKSPKVVTIPPVLDNYNLPINNIPFGTAPTSWCLGMKDQWKAREKSGSGLESIKAAMEESNCKYWNIYVP